MIIITLWKLILLDTLKFLCLLRLESFHFCCVGFVNRMWEMNGSFHFRAAASLDTAFDEPVPADHAGVCVWRGGGGAVVRNILSKSGWSISAYELQAFLSAFAESRKAAINFIVSVRLSVRMEQLGSHWLDFH
jgi:hypothetical protein